MFGAGCQQYSCRIKMVKMEDEVWLKKTGDSSAKILADLVDCIDISSADSDTHSVPVGRGRGRPKYSLSALTIPLLQSDADRLNSNIDKTAAGTHGKGRGRRLKCGKNLVSEIDKTNVEKIIGVMRKDNNTFTEEFPALGLQSYTSKNLDQKIVKQQFEDSSQPTAETNMIDLYNMKDLKKLKPRDCFIFVDELPCDTKREDIRKLFEEFGTVVTLDMQHERGLILLQRAVVCMNSKKSCDRAFCALRGTCFKKSPTAMAIQKLSEVIRKEDDLKFHLFK